MHIPYKAQVVLVARCLAYGLPPFFYELENLVLYSRRVNRRTFRKAADKLVKEFFGTDLEVERVAAILDTYVEELCYGELCCFKAGHHRHTLSARRATF